MEQYVVVFEDNGCDIFNGTYDECERYIEEIQVKCEGHSSDEFGIYPL